MDQQKTHMNNSAVDWRALLRRACHESLVAAAVFSGVANLLMLVPAFYMLNVYDKAIGSNSLSTLVVLSIITLLMFIGLGAMETVRSRVLVAIGARIDFLIGPSVYEAIFSRALRAGSINATAEPLNDFANLRQFAAGKGAITVLDTPWIPIYIFVMFLFHPVLGWLGVVSSLAMVAVAIANQKSTSGKLQAANAIAQRNMATVRRDIANAEVVAAMGMFSTILHKWKPQQQQVIAAQTAASHLGGLFAAITKTFRLAIQSIAIGVGALLVLQQEISPGMLIAGSILVGRALQPIELAVGSWKGFVDARGQYQRLQMLFANTDWQYDRMALPAIRGGVSANKATITPPGTKTPSLREATFEISPGSICMVIGPSGAGKSTLIRGVLGLWPTSSGDIRIDGAESSHYNRTELGPQIGYLPQTIELFEGSVSEHIARQGEVNAQDVIEAARDAGIHDFILSLPAGYDTVLGQEGGVLLSPGQCQRLALARALYCRPQLVVLDEPNSNLDRLGEMALNRAIETLRAAGSTVIIVSHREGAMKVADQLLVISSGSVVDSGPTEEVLSRIGGHQGGSRAIQHGAGQRQKKMTVQTIPI